MRFDIGPRGAVVTMLYPLCWGKDPHQVHMTQNLPELVGHQLQVVLAGGRRHTSADTPSKKKVFPAQFGRTRRSGKLHL
jgi:hypothetical protein